jgi:hypothetical protein
MSDATRYSHQDGRIVDLCSESEDSFSLWQIYPVRDSLGEGLDRRDADKKLEDDGFALHEQKFSPPCPRCKTSCLMLADSGLYFCTDCERAY